MGRELLDYHRGPSGKYPVLSVAFFLSLVDTGVFSLAVPVLDWRSVLRMSCYRRRKLGPS